MSGQARLFVEQEFSKERLLQDTESLYVELMGPQITQITQIKEGRGMSTDYADYTD